MGLSHGLAIKPSPILLGAAAPGVAVALLNRVRPLGLDRTSLHIGSADQSYLVPWSTITGVVTVPGNLFQSERLRIRIADSNLVPGWWSRRRWVVRVRPGGELEVPLGYGQAGVGSPKRFVASSTPTASGERIPEP